MELNYTQITHPVLQHHLTLLRRKETRPPEFRRILSEMARLIAFEATQDLPLKKVAIETPMEKMTDAPAIAEELVVVSIMRAGNGMLDGVLQALPFAQAGHIGMYRDKFVHATVEYFFKLPEPIEGRQILLLDPLLATGDTAVASLKRLKEYGVGSIRLVSLLAAPEGIAKVNAQHPDVRLFTLSVERGLTEKGFLLPGLGDAGDRLYGTERL
ncbi:MAG: uracil phosphoribosyltransferase [Bdellovibrionales bacterium]|nr:uracil phosphoribosyltransferase [Bdellovibrionales bacterium]